MIDNSVNYIKSRINIEPEIGIILGSSLGHVADEIEDAAIINYSDIPDFKVSTAPGHKGRLVCGKLSGKNVICMQGRLHYYEGHSEQDIVYPVKVMKLLGVKKLIVTNAAGGVNETFEAGDFMIIKDHINLTGTNPLIGKNDERFGVRFPDMTRVYSKELIAAAEKAAEEINIKVKSGVYLGCTGPTFETPAEVRAFRILGADAVGMSTVFEVIEAAHCGIDVLGISMITNMAAGVLNNRITEEEVAETGKRKSIEIKELIKAILKRM